MSRNQMKHSQSLHWLKVLKIVVVAGICLALGLSYITYKNQAMKVAQDTLKQKKELARIIERNVQLSDRINMMTSPQALQRRIHGSDLRPVGEMLVIRRDVFLRIARTGKDSL